MTSYLLPGYVQCNLVVLPRTDAFDFLLYCQRNPKACPVIKVTDPGDPEPRFSAPGADVRRDLGRYAVYRDGALVGETTDILDLWTRESVAFLIGSSMSFDHLLEQAGIPRSQIWMLDTCVATRPAGKFHGSLVVTMRLMTRAQAAEAARITAGLPLLHGAPVHIGDPAIIGAHVLQPRFGPPISEIPPHLVPVFWACGVTPQAAAVTSKIPLMISHVSGHAFLTDLKTGQLGLAWE